jgi:hypothetical protein
MARIPEAVTTQHSFVMPNDEAAAFAAIEAFTVEHGVSKSRNLRALGYGPMGADDLGFSPVFRKRYYLTKQDLHDLLDRLIDNGDDKENIELTLDTFKQDAQWFIKSRNDI